ncbi:hypothetical protein HN51_049325 [Arachis hypogaea]|nr:scarecrow-like protein 21 isoform X1 [Arachis ipaensis]XP_025666148.1 scarecrow-like protein 21 isoform X1 [Arachis hypogaea]QHN91021.1 Scarecrow-like protein [Arachis hypogaea]
MQTNMSYSCYFLQSENLNNNYPLLHNSEHYCTLESFSTNQNSPSSLSFSPEITPMLKQDRIEHDNESCLTHDQNDLSNKIRELESAMLGSDADILNTYGAAMIPQECDSFLRWRKMMEVISRGDLKEMLCACAKAMSENDMETTEWLISELQKMVSISGDPVQRLGAYMLEALVARLATSGSTIYNALRCKEPTGNELLSYMHMLYEICPYLKFGYLSANGSIAEAMKDENEVHIIDFQINQGVQWISLIKALAARPNGSPKIRITCFDDSTSAFARGGGLNIVGERLSRIANSCKVQFEFHALEVSPSEVKLDDLDIRPGESIAVNFAMMLHHLPDESVDSRINHRNRLLRLAKFLSPKVVTLVEQDCNTSNLPFFPRFVETMNYYLAVFESIDAALPRDHKERINVEQHCLAREVVNLIACEGAERVERHEALKKWRLRFERAGFAPYPLSSYVNSLIRQLQESYPGQYTLEERDGALLLGWKNQSLVVSCAWR